jgi:predicted Zn-dependent protease
MFKYSIKFCFLVLSCILTFFCYAHTTDITQIGGNYLSASAEEKIAQDFFKELKKQAVFVNDPIANDYILILVSRLAKAANLKRPLHLYLLADNQVNAFAGPGGYLCVNTGLFNATDKEGELAAVLAHELGHIKQQHLARMLASQKQQQLAVMAASIAAMAVGAATKSNMGSAASTALSAGYIQNLINFTRAHEEEADRVGMQILYNAGYNPMNMPHIFNHLADFQRLFPTDMPQYLSTHPFSHARVADTENRALQYKPKNYIDNDVSFEMVKVRLLVINSINPNLTIATLKSQKEKTNNEIKKIACDYGMALSYLTLRTPHMAEEIIQPLIQKYPNALVFQVVQANIWQQEHKYDEAVNLLKSFYDLYPTNYPLILTYVESLVAAGKKQQAKEILEEKILKFKDQVQLYYMLAKLEAETGDQAGSHLTYAKLLEQLNDITGAMRQLNIGLNTPSKDPYIKLQLKAELQKLQALKAPQTNNN